MPITINKVDEFARPSQTKETAQPNPHQITKVTVIGMIPLFSVRTSEIIPDFIIVEILNSINVIFEIFYFCVNSLLTNLTS